MRSVTNTRHAGRPIRWAGPGLLLLAFAGLACGGGERGGKHGDAKAAEPAPTRAAESKPAPDSSPRPGRPPRARFEAYPLEGLARLTAITFDASFSTDDRDLSSELLHQWDFDGNGTWDTGPTRADRTTFTYESAGRFRPRLRVIDSGGLADSLVGAEIAVRLPCPSPDFALTDVNPGSRSYGRTIRLSELRGHPVVAWFVAPTK
jgi:PKD repeat protein